MYELTDDDIAEFQALYKKECGKEICKERARGFAENLLTLVSLLLEIPSNAKRSDPRGESGDGTNRHRHPGKRLPEPRKRLGGDGGDDSQIL